MDKEKDEAFSKIDSKLADARNRAKEIFEKFSTEGIETQKLEVDSAKTEAVEINRKSKEEIEAATDKARAALKADIEDFSIKIVEKLVGK
jgi:F0F1-type ATP synthase membrane subunit b/b'